MKLYSQTCFIMTMFAEVVSRHMIPVPGQIDEELRHMRELQERVQTDMDARFPRPLEFDD